MVKSGSLHLRTAWQDHFDVDVAGGPRLVRRLQDADHPTALVGGGGQGQARALTAVGREPEAVLCAEASTPSAFIPASQRLP